MADEENVINFRFQLKYGIGQPSLAQVEEYEPFVYKDAQDIYYFGCKVGNVIKTCTLVSE